MIVICAWCKKDLGVKEPLEDKAVSHGMCPECVELTLEEIHTLHHIDPAGRSDLQSAGSAHQFCRI